MDLYKIRFEGITRQINDRHRLLYFIAFFIFALLIAVIFYPAEERRYIMVGGVFGILGSMIRTASALMRVAYKDEQRICKFLNQHWNISSDGLDLVFHPKRHQLLRLSDDDLHLKRSYGELYLYGPYYILKKVRAILGDRNS